MEWGDWTEITEQKNSNIYCQRRIRSYIPLIESYETDSTSPATNLIGVWPGSKLYFNQDQLVNKMKQLHSLNRNTTTVSYTTHRWCDGRWGSLISWNYVTSLILIGSGICSTCIAHILNQRKTGTTKYLIEYTCVPTLGFTWIGKCSDVTDIGGAVSLWGVLSLGTPSAVLVFQKYAL